MLNPFSFNAQYKYTWIFVASIGVSTAYIEIFALNRISIVSIDYFQIEIEPNKKINELSIFRVQLSFIHNFTYLECHRLHRDSRPDFRLELRPDCEYRLLLKR